MFNSIFEGVLIGFVLLGLILTIGAVVSITLEDKESTVGDSDDPAGNITPDEKKHD